MKENIMLGNHLKIALRNLYRQKGYVMINIAGLAIGIACCFIIVLFVLDEFSFDRHFDNAERIYRVAGKGVVGNQELNTALTSSLMAETLVREYPEVTHATRVHHTPNMLVSYGEKAINETHFLWVDSSFFDVFSISLLHGDRKTALAEHHTVVLSEEAARRYFADPADAIGKILNFEDGTPYRITAVMENPRPNTHFQYGMLAPLSSWEWDWRPSWLNHYMHTYIVLQEQADAQQLNAKFPAFIRKHIGPQIQSWMNMTIDEWQAGGSSLEYYLQPLTDIHLHSHLDGEHQPNSDIKYVYIFSVIALFILGIAAINFMNLATAKSAGRSKEVGMRKVLGARQGQLIRQFLLEAILLTFIAVLVAIILVELMLPYFNDIAGKSLSVGYFRDWYILPGILFVTLGVGFLAGVYPAFFLSAFKPVETIKGTMMAGAGGRSPLRSALVVLQFAVSIILFISTVVVYNQLQYIQQKRLGFTKENLVIIKRGWAIGQNPDGSLQDSLNAGSVMNTFKTDLLRNPGIKAVAGLGTLPGEDFGNGIFVPEGAPREEQHPLNVLMADYDLADVMELELSEGRFFSPDMASDSTAILINETAAKALGYQKPYVGKRVGFPGNRDFYLHIIGVVKDFHYESLHKPVAPLLIGLRTDSRSYIAVRIHPHNMRETVEFVEQTWNEYIPYKPFEYFFFDDSYDRLYRAEMRTGRLFGIFSVLAILIACLGLFGLASYITEQRTKEIGIRKVMGASVGSIVLRLSREFTRWVILANLIAWPVAWVLMQGWLQDFAYRIELNLLPFIIAALAAQVIALLTISYQSISAALANPVDALKYE